MYTVKTQTTCENNATLHYLYLMLTVGIGEFACAYVAGQILYSAITQHTIEA